MLLTFSLLAPALLLAAFLLWNVERQAQRLMENQLQETAAALSIAVDRELGGQAALLQALATSPALKGGDWAAFHAQAREAVKNPDTWIVLSTPEGQQLVNTRASFGTPLPRRPDGGRFSWAGARGDVQVSNLFYGPIAGGSVVTVLIPVQLPDGRTMRLSAGTLVSHFDRVFRDQKLPASWTGSLVDSTDSLMARSKDSARLTGRKASPDMRKAIASASSGVVKTQTLDGVATYSAFNRLPGYGWTVIVGVPRDEMQSAGGAALMWGLTVGLALLLLGALAALKLGAGVASPVEALAAAARASGPDRHVTIPPKGIREIDGLALAFSQAVRTVDAREAELIESEQRFRLVAEDAPVMLWMGDEAGKCLYLNKALRQFWGVREDLEGFTWAQTLHPDDQEQLFAVFSDAMTKAEPFEVEARYYRADKSVRTLFTRAVPRRDAEGRFIGMIGVNVDVTDARQAERRQQLLINELNHRVKNTLATVQSVAHQTLRAGESARDARELLTNRLMALSAAHNVLTRESWDGADLREIVDEAVRPYDGVEAPRFFVEGGSVRLGPRVALALSMALHELATNAAKYGSLSTPEGKVDIRWTVGLKTGLKLTWKESGGPPVTPPSRKGFGSRLLQQGLAMEFGGSAEIEFLSKGLVCTIRAPLGEVETYEA